MKKFLYTIFTTVLFTTTAFSQGEQRYANGSAIDQDGNTFEWINYGTQDWAIENAEVVTYRDGTFKFKRFSNIFKRTWSSKTWGKWYADDFVVLSKTQYNEKNIYTISINYNI